MSEASQLNESERRSGYRPEQAIQIGPLYQRPLRLSAIIKWLFGFPGYFLPWLVFFFGLAVVSCLYLTPDLDRMRTLSVDWIALLFVRNLTLLVVFVGALHAWLYSRKSQGTDYKYNGKWLAADNPTFLFRNQLWDNVFWNVCSAVPIWTAYEALTFWLQANGFAPTVSWQTHPAYCVLLILLTPLWAQTHFYTTHRLLHWPPLYRSVHYIHHKNVNFGPWSGVAMHPVEHLIFFSAVVLYWFIPSHPVHVLFMLLILAISSSVGHIGFDRLVLSEKSALNVNNYMHYLHHKHFNVNFGNDVGFLPFDKWFGTFHDGSEEATKALKARMRARAFRSRQREAGSAR